MILILDDIKVEIEIKIKEIDHNINQIKKELKGAQQTYHHTLST